MGYNLLYTQGVIMIELVGVVGAVVLILILMYNSLIGKKNEVENIFASVDTVLKKRYDLIPNLVEAVAKYMDHEKSLLQKVTELRAQGMRPDLSQKEKISIDKQMSSAIGSIMVAVEDYPDLKANENMMHLQRTLHEVEAQISAARRAYNQAVTNFNNAIEMIPTNVMATMMKYERKDVFDISEEERDNVSLKRLFKESEQP